MLLHFREERFTTNQNTKLMPRGDVPFQVLERLNSNVNKINLPPEYQVHNTFNVWDLSLFSTLHDDDTSNLRINYLEKKGENDAIRIAPMSCTQSQDRDLQRIHGLFMKLEVLYLFWATFGPLI